jgi:hypothetical protein
MHRLLLLHAWYTATAFMHKTIRHCFTTALGPESNIPPASKMPPGSVPAGPGLPLLDPWPDPYPAPWPIHPNLVPYLPVGYHRAVLLLAPSCPWLALLLLARQTLQTP